MFFVLALTVSEKLTFQIFDLEKVKVKRSGVISWQILKSIEVVVSIYALALIVFLDITFKLFYLAKVCQGHGVQLSQWCYSIANLKPYKNRGIDYSRNLADLPKNY